ncbi:hypothetical protein PIB30_077001 [Stylosanthes scabra]|uniref:Uncharacterized protein n=1 Tax=Stylosanthes scabra TaxID=79078 RepID=A0ABU6XNE2_9FABA|nr:hypothetical protein [Stylosanthes scabra]
MPNPSAGHELMRRLCSCTRRLLGINPKYGFSIVECHGIYQSGPYCPFEYALDPRVATPQATNAQVSHLTPVSRTVSREVLSGGRNPPSPRKESGLIALVPYRADQAEPVQPSQREGEDMRPRTQATIASNPYSSSLQRHAGLPSSPLL